MKSVADGWQIKGKSVKSVSSQIVYYNEKILMATSVDLSIYEDIKTHPLLVSYWNPLCEYTTLIRGEIISVIAEQLRANNSTKGAGKWTRGT